MFVRIKSPLAFLLRVMEKGWMQAPPSGWECWRHSPVQMGCVTPCRKMEVLVPGKDTDNPPPSQFFYCRRGGIHAQDPYLFNIKVNWCQAAPNPHAFLFRMVALTNSPGQPPGPPQQGQCWVACRSHLPAGRPSSAPQQ